MHKNNNINKSYNLEYNDSIISPSTTKEIKRVEIEKKEYNIWNIISEIKDKIKEYNNIKEKKRKEFVILPRKSTNEIKISNTNYTKKKITSKTIRANDSINAYKRRNENNLLNTKNNFARKNNTNIGQYQYKKRTKELTNTNRNNKSSTNINLKNTNNITSNYSKYQRKTKELKATKNSSNIGSYKYQTNINTERFKNIDKNE